MVYLMRVLSRFMLGVLLLALLLVPAVMAYGSISLASNPDVASVLIIGYGLNTGLNYTTSTPSTLSNVPAGPYVAIASKPGYQSSVLTFSVLDSQATNLSFVLLPMPLPNGSLNVFSIPSGALVRVYSNSPPSLRFNGTSPLVLSNALAPGQYLVRISMAGYSDSMTVYNISSNQTTVVNASLIPLPPPGGILTLRSTPSNANVVVRYANNNSIADSGFTPFVTSLPAGAYALNFTLPGYYNYLANATVILNQGTVVNATMIPLPGTLSLYSNPLSSVIVRYANNSVAGFGSTPLQLGLPAGTYQINFSRPGYYNYGTSANVSSNQTTSINATLVPVSLVNGTLDVFSLPSQASVWIYNSTGSLFVNSTTPLLLNGQIAPGQYGIYINKPGYVEYNTNVTIVAGQFTLVNPVLVPLPPPSGQLYLYSTPSNTNVTVRYANNGSVANFGLTPLQLGLPVGAYLVNFTRTGYYNYGTLANVTSGQTTVVNATLIPLSTLGQLSVNSSPYSDATIRYAGNNSITYIGGTPLLINRTAGVYLVNLTHVGYYPYLANVTVTANQLTQLNAILTPIGPVGQLSVDSTPAAGLFIYTSGNQPVFNGNTPAYLANLTAGNYSVQLSLPGYYFYSNSSVGVFANQTTVLNITMTPYPLTGQLHIYSTPSGSSVRAVRLNPINNTLVGSTPVFWSVYEGTYLVNITHAGYYSYLANATVNASQTTVVNATLVPQ